MARRLSLEVERRKSLRVPPDHTPWKSLAILQPGRDVLVIDLSDGGALLESATRMSPGARTELQLFGPTRRRVPARVIRCRVVSLVPLRYEGAIAFDVPLRLENEASG